MNELVHGEISAEHVISQLQLIGINGVSTSEVKRFSNGAINSTFSIRDLVVKMNSRSQQMYLPNKIVWDHFRNEPELKIVNVLQYDARVRVPYEILVMKRSRGSPLTADLLHMTRNDIEQAFRETLAIMRRVMTEVHPPGGGFGEVNGIWDSDQTYRAPASFASVSDFVRADLASAAHLLNAHRILDEDRVSRLERYTREHLCVFEHPLPHERVPCLVHQDMHWENLLHEGPSLSAILDWDLSVWATPLFALLMLLDSIACPSTLLPSYAQLAPLEDHLVEWLLPVLRDAFKEEFADAALLRKLSLLRLRSCLVFFQCHSPASIRRSGLDRELERIVENELVGDGHEELSHTHFGQILSEMKNKK